MGLEEQLKFEFLKELEVQEEQHWKVLERENKIIRRINDYKDVAILGFLFGVGFTIVGLTNRKGFADDPYAIAMFTVGIPYLFVASQYTLDKLVDFKEKLSSFYRPMQEQKILTIYKS